MRSSWLALMLILVACKAPVVTQDTQTTAPAPPAVAGPRVIFPDGFVVNVELAADDETRAQGLMYRDQLRPGTGMLFFFPQEGHYPFWMKNTLIPLDMIWIDAGKRVAHVKYHVPPCKADPCTSHAPNTNASYVLEVAGGVAQEHGLRAGDTLRFEGVENVIIR